LKEFCFLKGSRSERSKEEHKLSLRALRPCVKNIRACFSP
jgi:hypothetical protein